MESPRTRPIVEGFFEKLFNHATSDAVNTGMAALKNALHHNSVVLTPNDRLATRLSHAYVAWATQSGQTQNGACSMPTFSSLNRWAQGQWVLLRSRLPRDHALAGRTQLLSTQSEWVLWQKLVSQTSGLSLLDEGGLASLAQEAYAIQRGWRMKTRELEAHAEGDQRYFIQWQAAFTAQCQSRAVLPRADLLAALLALPAQAGQPITRCCWLGFSELTPAELALFEAMPQIWQVTPEQMSLRECVPDAASDAAVHTAIDVAIGTADGHGAWGQTGICHTEDETEELHAAMAWLRQRFTPDAKLALVVPDLPTRKTSLERAFQSQWAPQWAPQALLELPDANLTDATLAEWVSFSGGTALSELPIYALVCTLAKMALGQISLEPLAVLLTNPYVGAPPIERNARRRLLQQLQAQQLSQWPLSGCLEIWRAAGLESALADCPDWVNRFEDCVSHLAFVEKVGFSPALLDTLLATWGWPGDSALDSAEYQQLKKWGGVRAQWVDMLQLRAQLAEQDEDGVDVADSVRYLQEILAGQIFQPKSQDTPLQVLGILEALEQPFDALWFMGAEDQVLPPAARPHPLLPQSLQRHYNSLRATPGRELALARETIRAFSALTYETCFSWSSRVGNREAAPSRLVAHLPPLWSSEALIHPPTGEAETDLADQSGACFDEQAVSLVACPQTHALAVAEPAKIKGGTGVMKTFAECPFKAFVRYRLGLDAPATPSLGLDAMLRGVLVHAVLEAVWESLGTQSALLSLSGEAQARLVKEKVTDVLNAFTAPEGLYLGHLLLSVEAKRLHRTTQQWLKLEAKRAPFRVAGIEKALMIELSGLRLNVRLDRMDETGAGDLLVIDYKTGHTDIGHWFGKRIQAPQLPLYAMALSPQALGVLYGIVKASKPQIKGTVAESVTVMQESRDSRSITPSPDWPAVVKTWQKTLEKSAADFVGGLAAVDPIEGTRTCERCAYAGVCRIQARVSAHADAVESARLRDAAEAVELV